MAELKFEKCEDVLKKVGSISWFLNKYDTVKADFADGIEDFFWFVVEIASLIIARFVTAVLSLQGKAGEFIFDQKSKSKSYSLGGKLLSPIALLFALIFWILITATVALIGNLAGLLGLRNRRYSFIESFFAWALFIAIALILPRYLGEYRVYQICQVAIFSAIALSLNIMVGYSGLLSLGHSAFVTIGAYVTILLNNGTFGGHTVPLYIAFIASGLVTGVMGIIIGLPAVRVKGPYLGIVTLSLGIVVPLVLKSDYLEFIGGMSGAFLTQPTPPEWLARWIILTDNQFSYYIILFPTVILFLVADFLLKRSKVGRALTMLDQDEVAWAQGINVFHYKLVSFFVSAFFAGVSGGLLGVLLGVINPGTFTVDDSISYLTAVVIGGLGSILGSFLGGMFLSYQTEFNQLLASMFKDGESYRGPIYGVVLILFVIFTPQGLAGQLRNFVSYLFDGAVVRRNRYRNPVIEQDDKELFDDSL